MRAAHHAAHGVLSAHSAAGDSLLAAPAGCLRWNLEARLALGAYGGERMAPWRLGVP